MFSSKPNAAATRDLAEQATQVAEDAISSTQRAAHEAMDGLADGVNHARDRAEPVIQRAAAQVEHLARRSIDAARDTTQQLRDSASRAGDSTIGYIRDEPVKAVLIAAAAGAALVAVASLLAPRISTRERR